MNHLLFTTGRKVFIFVSLSVLVSTMLTYFLRGKTLNAEALMEARRILPGYSVVFEGHTNVIQRCGSLRAFSQQHEMMEYLQTFAPYVERYNHPANRPIRIRETEERVIIELPSRFEFPPYNWTIYWGAGYEIKIEFDKKSKEIVDAVQG